jgi:hypothetical protein
MSAPRYIVTPPHGDLQSWAMNEYAAIERTLAGVVTDLQPRSQTSTSYTLIRGDEDIMLEHNNSSSITVTIPADSTTNFAIGTLIHMTQAGAGQVTITKEGGVTLNSRPGLKSSGQYAYFTVHKRAANDWRAFGDLTT